MGSLLEAAKSVVPVCVLLLCFAIFSGYTVIAKIALSGGTNPLVLAFLREIIAASVLMSGLMFTERRKSRELRSLVPAIEDSGSFMILGAVMVYGVQLISALALSRVTALNYALFAPLVPILTTSLALLVRMEYFDKSKWASWLKIGGILVAVAGAVTTAFGAVGHGSSSGSQSVILGNVLLVTNKLCISIYPLLEKRLFARGYSPLFVVAWGYVTGSVLTLLAVVPCTLTVAAWTVPASGWIAILYAGFLSSGFNYAAMAWVNKRTTPVLVMVGELAIQCARSIAASSRVCLAHRPSIPVRVSLHRCCLISSLERLHPWKKGWEEA
jgi:drug/metabolite transporter (DMT)-like permease